MRVRTGNKERQWRIEEKKRHEVSAETREKSDKEAISTLNEY